MESNRIANFIIENWDRLPKSYFDDVEVVIFDEVYNNDSGWGHHSYEGYGVTADGRIVYCTSSGCSCSGSCDVSTSSIITVAPSDISFDNYTEIGIDFNALEVHFTSYDD